MVSFGGIIQKCKVCDKIVYLVDQLIVDFKVYYKVCFRCYYCKGIFKVFFNFLNFYYDEGYLCYFICWCFQFL